MEQKRLNAIAILIRRNIRNRLRKNKITPKTNKQGKSTLVNSGRLLRSISYRISGNTIYIGTNLKYARIHHEGGVFFPKKAKYLTIPLTPAAKFKSAREWNNTFIRNGIIYHTREPGGKIEALFKLQRSVKIPARPYMFISNEDRVSIENQIANYYNRSR